MQKEKMILEAFGSGKPTYRAIIKTRHGRTLYLSLEIEGPACIITNCFYTDRNQGRTGEARYSARLKKLQTLQFPTADLLSVIETELDRKFFGVELWTRDKPPFRWRSTTGQSGGRPEEVPFPDSGGRGRAL